MVTHLAPYNLISTAQDLIAALQASVFQVRETLESVYNYFRDAADMENSLDELQQTVETAIADPPSVNTVETVDSQLGCLLRAMIMTQRSDFERSEPEVSAKSLRDVQRTMRAVLEEWTCAKLVRSQLPSRPKVEHLDHLQPRWLDSSGGLCLRGQAIIQELERGSSAPTATGGSHSGSALPNADLHAIYDYLTAEVESQPNAEPTFGMSIAFYKLLPVIM